MSCITAGTTGWKRWSSSCFRPLRPQRSWEDGGGLLVMVQAPTHLLGLLPSPQSAHDAASCVSLLHVLSHMSGPPHTSELMTSQDNGGRGWKLSHHQQTWQAWDRSRGSADFCLSGADGHRHTWSSAAAVSSAPEERPASEGHHRGGGLSTSTGSVSFQEKEEQRWSCSQELTHSPTSCSAAS